MVRFSHDDLPASGSTGDWFKDAATGARDTFCSIHSDYPSVTTGIDGSIPGSAGSVRKALADAICRKSPAPKPSNPVALFSGGQCPLKYRIEFATVSTRADGLTHNANYGINVWGGIGGVGTRKNPNFPNEFLTLRCHGIVPGNRSPTPMTLDLFASFFERFTSIQVTQVYTIDGEPDLCGNPNPQYPPELTKPLPIPFPVPPLSPPPGGFPPLPVVIPTGIFINNDFNVTIDVGGIEFNFDAGGVEFNLGNRDGCDGSKGSCSAPPGGNFPDDYANKDDVENIVTRVDQTKEAAEGAKTAAEGAKKNTDDAASNDGDHPQNDPNKQNKEQKQEDDPKEEAGIERLLAVEVELLSMPSNRRTQDGRDAPDVNYAGWFEFSTKGVPHPREPIHFERNYFIAPVGSDGYAYTVYNGFTARATVITAKAT